MNSQDLSQTPGEEFGCKALTDALAKADAYCTHETQRIALENQSRLAAVRAELALLHDEECALQERLHKALPPLDAKDRRRKAVYYWLVTLALTVAGFFFSLLAFEPYRLGWKSYLYCAGIALISPFCVEKFLETWASPRLFKALATIACVAALAALVLLSLVRGDVLAQEVRNVTPVVVFSGATPATPPQTDFYNETLSELRLLMALLALSMEIGAGLALYEARRHSASTGEDPARVTQELRTIQECMVSKLQELHALENQAAIFANHFWRDFYRALSDGMSRRAIVKVSALFLGALLVLAAPSARAADNLNLVIALDLTKSVAVGSPGESQEFQKNVEAAGQILARIPAGAHLTLVGITDQSFGEPFLLLEARIPEDPGYFGERLNAARRALLQAWVERTKNLHPKFTRTDIFGALLLASQVFLDAPKGRGVLIIFSDMRENAGNSNLEKLYDAHLALARAAQASTFPDLQGVEVHVLGADNAGKHMNYWQTLRDFWTAYFKKTGADLKNYSVLRDPPDLSP